MHVMIDIETLATTPDAVVMSVGAVKFDPKASRPPTNKTLWRPDIDEQTARDRHVSESTLEWWSRQPTHIQDDAFSEHDRITVKDFMKELNRYCVGADKIWCQGPQFDLLILENFYTQWGHHFGWQFWQVMDCRTLFQLMPTDPRKAIQQDLHSADADAYFQALGVQQCYKHFGLSTNE